MYKTIDTVRVYHILNGNIAIAIKVPRLRCLVEFQRFTEQIVSRSPKYLINQMENYYECKRLQRTFDVHIEINVMPSKRHKFEG